MRGCIRSTWERYCELLAQRALRDPHDGCACDRCMGSSSLPVPRFPFPRCSFCTGTGAQLARLRAWQLTPALPAKPTLTVPLAWHGSVRALLALDDPRLADDCPPAAAAMLCCLAEARATCRYCASSHKARVLASHWHSPEMPRQSRVVGSCSGSSGSPAVLRLTHGMRSALICWHWLLLAHGRDFGFFGRRRLQLARCASLTLVLCVLARVAPAAP